MTNAIKYLTHTRHFDKYDPSKWIILPEDTHVITKQKKKCHIVFFFFNYKNLLAIVSL